jgi:hypothetical protein
VPSSSGATLTSPRATTGTNQTTTGSQRAHSKLAKKRVLLDTLYADTPRIWPDSRQIRRADQRALATELASLRKKEARKIKRDKKKDQDGATLSAVQ